MKGGTRLYLERAKSSVHGREDEKMDEGFRQPCHSLVRLFCFPRCQVPESVVHNEVSC